MSITFANPIALLPKPISILLKTLSITTLLVLVGCGDGGGDAPPSVNDLSQTFELGSGTNDPFNMSGDNELTGLDRDIELYGPIANFFGNAVFSFQFTGTEGGFVLSVDWGVESLIEFEDGTFFLSGLGRLVSVDADNNVSEPDTQIMQCLILNASVGYFCSMSLSAGETLDFRLVNSFEPSDPNVIFARSGVMEFCGEEVSSTLCAEELFNSPDGTAIVLISPSTVASILENSIVATNDNTAVDHYFNYLDQGSASLDGLVGPTNPIKDSIADSKRFLDLQR